mmetsp:Transcript_433/g.723  ORF Transcript_433/g.723 Transcript_433/m.723 type:complete len:425 (-) Transcript_433:616-1890(-)
MIRESMWKNKSILAPHALRCIALLILLIAFHLTARRFVSTDYYTNEDGINRDVLASRMTISRSKNNTIATSTDRDIVFSSSDNNDVHKAIDDPFDKSSTTITNNVPWKDNNNRIIEAGRGGKITWFDGYWWWVGSQPAKMWNDGGDIYLYKSQSLGSNSWQFVRRIYEFPGNVSSSNCRIHKHPTTIQILVHCSSRKIVISDDGIDGEFKLHEMSDDPSGYKERGWKWGSGTVFQDDSDMYMAVSWCDKPDGSCMATTRRGLIYKLNSNWTDFDETDPIVSDFVWPHREAYDMFKKGNWYYLAASETQRWRQSRSWYKRSLTIKGLQDAKEKQMVMHLSNDENVLSMGTQFRTLIRAGSGKWLFGGSRHPDEDPQNFDPKHGRFIFVPVKFIRGVPHVFWKSKFNWDTYSYETPDHDPYQALDH